MCSQSPKGSFKALVRFRSRQIQMILFMKNVSMLGGAFPISHFGAGTLSLDARRSR
jgi:uncharacterized membrane protein YphA (DoxX/SURF4 family)